MVSDLQNAIIAAARGWIGTRFHHQGRVKRTALHAGGCDCLGLLIGVAKEVGLTHITHEDSTDYGHYPDTDRLHAALGKVMKEIAPAERQPGDILAFCIDGSTRHLGILSEHGFIHAYAPARAVVEHGLDKAWESRLRRVFRIQ